MKKFKIICFIALVVLPLFDILVAQDIVEIKKLLPKDLQGKFSESFGYSVAVDGQTAIIGIPFGGMNGTAGGIAKIFEYEAILQKWIEVKTVFPSDRVKLHNFGHSVSLSGKIAIIGSPSNGTSYVYYKDKGGINNWGEVKILRKYGHFGCSVSISDSTAIVGYRLDSSGGPSFGAAYIFSKNVGGENNWGEVKRLIASDPSERDNFGSIVSISGDVVVVGAELRNIEGDFGGAAYIYSKNENGVNNWGEVKKLKGGDTSAFDSFGESIAISGNTVIIGAPDNKIDDLIYCGSAYIFYKDAGGRDNWGEVKELFSETLTKGESFGTSVSISEGVAIVGSLGDQESTGAAYIFEKDFGGADIWGQANKLLGKEISSFNYFGRSVSVNGSHVFIGAPGDFHKHESGSTHVLMKIKGSSGNWIEKDEIKGEMNLARSEFGISVSISGDVAVVGSPGDNYNGYNSGAAFLFRKIEDRWARIKEIRASDAAEGDLFGSSVSISNDIVIISAEGDDYKISTNVGSVYLYSKHKGGNNNWGEITKIKGGDPSKWSNFGTYLSISDDVAIVGGSQHFNRIKSNEIYIYSKDQGGENKWGEIKIIESKGMGYGDDLFRNVAISGDIAIIGAMRTGTREGSAYILSRDSDGINNWGLLKRIEAKDQSTSLNFGYSVAIHDQVAIVGSIPDGFTNEEGGVAFIYSKNRGGIDNWGKVKMVKASDSVKNNQFGINVSISGNLAVVGGEDSDGIGAVYLYNKDTGGLNSWGEVKKIQANDISEFDYFGRSVSIDKNVIITGAFGDSSAGRSSGSAYLFQVNN